MVGIDYYKKNKILIAVIDKGRTRTPSREFPFDFLFNRLNEEVNEITYMNENERLDKRWSLYSVMVLIERAMDEAQEGANIADMKLDIPFDFFEQLYNELADISNFVDFMFNRASMTEELLKMHEVIP